MTTPRRLKCSAKCRWSWPRYTSMDGNVAPAAAPKKRMRPLMKQTAQFPTSRWYQIASTRAGRSRSSRCRRARRVGELLAGLSSPCPDATSVRWVQVDQPMAAPRPFQGSLAPIRCRSHRALRVGRWVQADAGWAEAADDVYQPTRRAPVLPGGRVEDGVHRPPRKDTTRLSVTMAAGSVIMASPVVAAASSEQARSPAPEWRC